MSHEVESMAYAHEVPWHGLGANVRSDLSYKEMLVASGLDWTVSLRKMQFRGSDKKMKDIPRSFVLARDSDDRPLSTAGGRYKPVQNEEALRFFDRFVRAGHATLETAGSLRNGELVWCLAKLGHDFKLPGGDKVKGYLLLVSPHKVGKSLFYRTTAIRVVCANTLAMATAGGSQFERKFPHVRDFNADEASEALADANESMVKFSEIAHALHRLKLSKEEAVRILLDVYQADADRSAAQVKKMIKDEKTWNPTVKSVFECYVNAPGATEGTGWGLLNGATYRANHKAGKSADNRLATLWVGKEGRRTMQLLDVLSKKAA